MFNYSQPTGRLSEDGTLVGTGYSGFGDDKNVDADQSIPNLGPIPVGEYEMSEPYTDPEKGVLCFRLTPKPGNQMYGRSGFLLHGDSISHPGAASHGCIVMGHAIRQVVADSGDRDLTVVACEELI